MARKTKKAETSKPEAENPAESVETNGSDTATETPVTDTPGTEVEDAEIIEEIAPPEPEPSEEAPTVEPPEEEKKAPEVAEDDTAEGVAEETPDAAPDSEARSGPDTTDRADAPAPVPQPEQVVIRKGGFLPMLLGGAAAALIGFGAARYVLPEGWPWPGARDDAFEQAVAARLDAQDTAVAEVRAAIPVLPDLSPLETRIAEFEQALQDALTAVQSASARLDTLEAQLTELEKRPMTEAVSPAAVQAYENELKALQQAVAAQRAEIEKLAAEAAQKEANAEVTAQEAMLRAALNRIQTALDAGTGFADAVDTLRAANVALPDVLVQTADAGVFTRAELADRFPAAARAALSVARQQESGGGLGRFLANQLGARSLEPREGDDADAVLSRAEAAVRDGRITDALAELDALPEPARAEMADWLSRARNRLDALAAAETLAAQLN
ncbi:COG4223 family protein [Marimonas arenosa]|uniref:Mitofilin family membrane protein n=1 Tax=Marimonas arenosa TaxID=1795305 RepID=A0AAE4B4L7_9RHOB|nr:mitofilin family membrane protein [Marimonas arenosa]MDQ2090350.1 mitofilin family membrane protein [Marimonas arenosa]